MRGRVREFGIHMYTLLYVKWITDRTYCIPRGACSRLCGSLDGRGAWARMDTCIKLAKFLCCPSETI